MFMIYEYDWDIASITTTNGFKVLINNEVVLETLLFHKAIETYIVSQRTDKKASIELQKVELCNNDSGLLFNLEVYFTSNHYNTGVYIARDVRDSIRHHEDMVRDRHIDLLRYRFIKPLSRFIVEGCYHPLEVQSGEAFQTNVNWSTEGF